MRCRIFLDRDLGGRIVAGHLKAHGWDVTTANERYTPRIAEGLADDVWIRDVASEFVIVSSDHAIGKRPLQASAIRYTSARILIVNANATALEQAEVLVANCRSIDRLVARREGPWIFGVRANGLRSIHLVPA